MNRNNRKRRARPVSSSASTASRSAAETLPPAQLPEGSAASSAPGGVAASGSAEDAANPPPTVPSELALCALLLAVSTFLSLILLYLGQSPQHLGGGWEVWDGHLLWEQIIDEAPARVRWSGSGFHTVTDPAASINCTPDGICENDGSTGSSEVEASPSSWFGAGLSFLWFRERDNGNADGASSEEGSHPDIHADEESEFASEASSSSATAFAFDADDLPLADFTSTRCDFERVQARKMTAELFRERFYLKSPVIISGGATAWPALENWRRTTLQDRYGDRPVRVGTAREIIDNDCDGPHEMRVCDYLRLMRRLPLVNTHGSAAGAGGYTGEGRSPLLPLRGNMLGSDLQHGMAASPSVAAAVEAAGQVMGVLPVSSEFDDDGAYVRNRRFYQLQKEQRLRRQRQRQQRQARGEEKEKDEQDDDMATAPKRNKTTKRGEAAYLYPGQVGSFSPDAPSALGGFRSDVKHGPDQFAYLFDRDGIFRPSNDVGDGGAFFRSSAEAASDASVSQGAISGGLFSQQHEIVDDIVLPRWLLDMHDSWLKTGTSGPDVHEENSAGDIQRDQFEGAHWREILTLNPLSWLSAFWHWWRGIVAWQLGYEQSSDGTFYHNLVAEQRQVSQSSGDGRTGARAEKAGAHYHVGGESGYSLAFHVGSNNTGLPLHMHTDAFDALVYGAKHWIFYNASRSPPGYPSRLGHHSWLMQILPLLPSHERPMQCVQYPGDIMYIPETWFYATHSLGETVGMTAQAAMAQTPGLRTLHDSFEAFARGLQASSVAQASSSSSKGTAGAKRDEAGKPDWLNPALEMTKKAAAMVPAEAFRAFEVSASRPAILIISFSL